MELLTSRRKRRITQAEQWFASNTSSDESVCFAEPIVMLVCVFRKIPKYTPIGEMSQIYVPILPYSVGKRAFFGDESALTW